ncbi:MAG TPA: ribosomal protein S18-alanine N-acetyltransferase [Longimicrobiaceae bacterium]
MKLGGEVPRTGSASFRLRPISESDLDRVMEIERACFSTPWKDTTFRGLMRRADTDLVGAERDRRLVGYAVCWTVVDQSELGNVAVAEEARGAGIGRALVEAVVERVRARGSRECFLEVRESNQVAQALYRDMGFEVVGRRKAYYALPLEDALVMRLFV